MYRYRAGRPNTIHNVEPVQAVKLPMMAVPVSLGTVQRRLLVYCQSIGIGDLKTWPDFFEHFIVMQGRNRRSMLTGKLGHLFGGLVLVFDGESRPMGKPGPDF